LPARQGRLMIPRAQHDRMANAIRALAMDAVETAKSGHPGLPMGRRRRGDRPVYPISAFRSRGPCLARSRPFRALRRPRLDADLCGAAPARGRGDHHRGDQAVPAAWIDHARASGTRPHAGHRDDDGTARSGARQCGRNGDRGGGARPAHQARLLGRVVSVPCFELFLASPAHVRQSVIGDAPLRIAVEAAVRQGWDAIIGSDGLFIGMAGFGASAPYKDLYRRFGITAEAALSKLIH